MLYIDEHINDFEPTLEELRAARRLLKFRCDAPTSTIIDVLNARGWTQVEDDDDTWDLYWNDVNRTAEILDSRQFEAHQRIPHFRNHFELTRKNLLAKNLRHYRRFLRRQKCRGEALAEIMPRTYEIPSEYAKFLAHFDKSPGITWILKPATGRQGSGIFLFQALSDLDAWREDLLPVGDDPVAAAAAAAAKRPKAREPRATSIDLPGVYVLQKYVERPYLIDGKKFDIRFYVLVTSWRPLTAWLSRDGFARICGIKYSLEDLRANRVHLTNMAIQLRPASSADSLPGTKWTMQKLKSFLEEQHGVRATGELMERVCALVMTSLRSVAKRIRADAHCFELYGYDVLLDDKLKPWLLEVNASPSLNATGPDDYRMKFDLLNDVVNIVNFEQTFTGFESRIGGFDLLWKDGPVLTLRDPVGDEGDYDNVIGKAAAFLATDSSYPDRRLNGHLGEPNDRVDQLAILKFQRQVAKVIANLPSEPLWQPPADLSVPEQFFADHAALALAGLAVDDILASGPLVWDKATVGKVAEVPLFDVDVAAFYRQRAISRKPPGGKKLAPAEKVPTPAVAALVERRVDPVGRRRRGAAKGTATAEAAVAVAVAAASASASASASAASDGSDASEESGSSDADGGSEASDSETSEASEASASGSVVARLSSKMFASCLALPLGTTIK